jgi:hypothetical protein
VIVASGVRAKQSLRTENVTPVKGYQGSGSEDVGVGWRQQIQARFRLIQAAQSPEALCKRELRRSVPRVGTDSAFQFFCLHGSVNRLVSGERTEEQVPEIGRLHRNQRGGLSGNLGGTALLSIKHDQATTSFHTTRVQNQGMF